LASNSATSAFWTISAWSVHVASHTTTPDARVLLNLDVRERERLGQHLQEPFSHESRILGRAQSFGQVQEFVVTGATERIRRSRGLRQAVRDRDE